MMKNDSKKVKRGILSAGWYYLIFLLMTIVGFGLLFSVPGSFVIGAIGASIGFIGFYSLVGFPLDKYTYSETKTVKLDSGEEIKCTLIRRRKHFVSFILTFVVSILPFVPSKLGEWLSLFYHIPLGTQYFIACNLDRADDNSGKFSEGQFEKLFDYLNCEQITKKRYKELMSNPQLYKDELMQKLSKQKAVFFEVVEKFEKNSLVEREKITDSYAIYKLSDELVKAAGIKSDENHLRIKLNYTGNTETQKGFLVFESLLEKGISYEEQFPFERIVVEDDEHLARQYVELNNDLFSSLMIHKEVNENTGNKFIDIDKLEEIKETDSRDVLTKEIVCRVARNKRKGGLLFLCIIAYYFASPFVALTVYFLFALNILGFVCSLLLSAALIFIAEYARRKNKAISRIPSIDEIEIVKTYCDKKQINEDNTCTYTLGNGLVVTENGKSYRLDEKTTCYIIYRKPENEIKWIYSSKKVRLSPDLKVSDSTINND